MTVRGYLPVVPSSDLERSLKLWRDGLGFDETWYEERREGKLVGCGLNRGANRILLNIRYGVVDKPESYEGVRFYWTPDDLHALRERLLQLGFAPGQIEDRYYGQSEFTLVDDDGFDHCFGVSTESLGAPE